MKNQKSAYFKNLKTRLKPVLLPRRLLAPNTKPSKHELARVLDENAMERNWYKDVPSFRVVDEIIEAAEDGYLAHVAGNSNYLPIMRLRNKELLDVYPPYLTNECKALLDEICSAWRTQAKQINIPREIRLAVTSLVRSLDYQHKIVKSGKLADPGSVHTKGEAFDIDASGYYVGEAPVNARADKQEEFEKAFNQLGAKIKAPKFIDYKEYQPEVHKVLEKVLAEMQHDQKLHFVHEHPGSTNAVYHICRNPKYSPGC